MIDVMCFFNANLSKNESPLTPRKSPMVCKIPVMANKILLVLMKVQAINCAFLASR